jgi:hypothetical protein
MHVHRKLIIRLLLAWIFLSVMVHVPLKTTGREIEGYFEGVN